MIGLRLMSAGSPAVADNNADDSGRWWLATAEHLPRVSHSSD